MDRIHLFGAVTPNEIATIMLKGPLRSIHERNYEATTARADYIIFEGSQDLKPNNYSDRTLRRVQAHSKQNNYIFTMIVVSQCLHAVIPSRMPAWRDYTVPGIS